MNIGDRVRVIHGSESGIVTRVIDAQQVEIEIEDGFTIPVLVRDLALVATEEDKHFDPADRPTESTERKNTSNRANEKSSDAKKGIYIAFEPIGKTHVLLYFINNTSFELAYSIFTKNGEQCQRIHSGSLSAHSLVKMTDWALDNFENWPLLHIEALYSHNKAFTYRSPLRVSLKVKAAGYHKNRKEAPLLGKPCHLFQIDQQIPKHQVEAIKEKMLGEKAPSPVVEQGFVRPASTVDLHIEKLVENEQEIALLSNREMLSVQMDHFHKAFNGAIIAGMEEITFIHGNGTLKKNIQKELSQSHDIKFYKDAMKEKFGYGATLVKIK